MCCGETDIRLNFIELFIEPIHQSPSKLYDVRFYSSTDRILTMYAHTVNRLSSNSSPVFSLIWAARRGPAFHAGSRPCTDASGAPGPRLLSDLLPGRAPPGNKRPGKASQASSRQQAARQKPIAPRRLRAAWHRTAGADRAPGPCPAPPRPAPEPCRRESRADH